MPKLSKEAKQRLQQLFKGGQFAIRWGFIPVVLYLGQCRAGDARGPSAAMAEAGSGAAGSDGRSPSPGRSGRCRGGTGPREVPGGGGAGPPRRAAPSGSHGRACAEERAGLPLAEVRQGGFLL